MAKRKGTSRARAGMFSGMFAGLFAVALMPLMAVSALAKDNLASDPTDLPDLEMKEDLTVSQTEYHVETGKAYRLVIKSDGGESFSFHAPDFFQQVWIDGIAVEGVTVKTTQLTALDFEDDGGEVEILFVPIRPGNFEFWAEGYQTRGMLGHFVVE